MVRRVYQPSGPAQAPLPTAGSSCHPPLLASSFLPCKTLLGAPTLGRVPSSSLVPNTQLYLCLWACAPGQSLCWALEKPRSESAPISIVRTVLALLRHPTHRILSGPTSSTTPPQALPDSDSSKQRAPFLLWASTAPCMTRCPWGSISLISVTLTPSQSLAQLSCSGRIWGMPGVSE